MTRPVVRRPTQLTVEKPEAPAELAPVEGSPTSAGAPAPPRLSWGWRVFWFFWVTSFLCLLLSEILDALFRVARRLLGSP